MKRAHLLGVFGLAAIAAITAIACGDDGDTTIASPDAGAPDGGNPVVTPVTDAATTPDAGDAGDDDDDSDASTIDDGGANIDPDAGDDDDDAGDAGPCNTVTNDAPSILSLCSSQIPGLTGGALVAGTYRLTQVAALGSVAFCENQFVPVRIAETMVLTVDATGTGTAQLVTTIANSQKSKANTLTLAPTNNASPLAQTQTCPPKDGEKTIYESVVRNQKQLLIIEENYGTGRGLYRYEKQ